MPDDDGRHYEYAMGAERQQLQHSLVFSLSQAQTEEQSHLPSTMAKKEYPLRIVCPVTVD